MKKQIMILVLLLIAVMVAATTINVPADYSTIQAGINAASDGDVVLVEPGAYVENIDFNGKNITVASHYLTYEEESYIEQTVILGTGSTSVVKFDSGETNNAKLIGFTVTGGSGYSGKGGGIYCDDSSPTLEHLIVSGNHISSTSSSNSGGGGIYGVYSSMIISNVTIQDNSVSNIYESHSGGGGLYLYNSDSVTLTNLTVKNNSISGSGSNSVYGGSVFLYSSDYCTMDSVFVENNLAENDYPSYGGGLFLYYSDSATLENIIINGNSAVSTENNSYGGGLSLYYSDSATLENIIIDGNSAVSTVNYSRGGGLYLSNSSNAVFTNLILRNNFVSDGLGAGAYLTNSGYTFNFTEISENYFNSTSSSNKGGGIYLDSGTLSLMNCTVTNNDEDFAGAGIYSKNAVSLTNSIIWDNEIELESSTSNLTVSYCDIEGGQEGIINDNNASIYWLGENINQDPLFFDIANSNYHLTASSPCIDAGSPYSEYDPDETIADMGAYYYDQSGVVDQPTITVNTPTIDACPGDTVAYNITLSIPDTVLIHSIEATLPCFDYPVTESSLAISDELNALGWLMEMNDEGCPILTWFAGAEGITGDINILNGSVVIDADAEDTFVPLSVTSIQFNETLFNIVFETGGINVIVEPPLEPDYGDVSLNGTISAWDGSLILQYLIDEVELDEQQQLNAEVSGDETISAMDASLILQYGVELISEFPAESGEDVVLALGNIFMEDMQVEPNTSISVPLYLENGDEIFSFEFDFSFDSSMIEFTGVETGDSLGDFQVMHSQNENILKIVGASAYEDGEAGVFLELSFNIPADFGNTETEIILSEMRFNENEIIVNGASAILSTTVNTNDETLLSVTKLNGNYPNPFNPTTTFSFSIPNNSNIELSIFNIKGQKIKSLVKDSFVSGNHSIVWNGNDDTGKSVSSGVYFYKLNVNGVSKQIRKCILMK